MKTSKLFFGMLAIAGMLATTSCVKESIDVANGNDAVATFTIKATDALATRAIGEGETADVVACAVFDANGVELTELRNNELPVTNGTAKYQIRVAKGQAYRVAFFAYNKLAAAYDLTDFKSIKVNGNQASNIEARDAFTNYIDITAEETANGEIVKPVTLYRPFAQLNLGIDDAELANARKAGVVVTNSQITVTNVYNAFNAFDNDIADDAVAGTVKFAMNAIPDEKLLVDTNNDGTDEQYNYLALNYLLIGDKGQEKSLTDVEFVWATADGKTNNPTTHFVNIPVQRNYRTNILGHLLTNPSTFNITIDADFEKPDYVEEIETNVTNVVTTAAELQAAIDAAIVGQNLIKFGANIGGTITVNQKPDVEILIDGQGHTFSGTFFVAGGSNWGNTEGLSIQNMIFYKNAMSAAGDCIILGQSGDTGTRYVHNVIITNCEFTVFGPKAGDCVPVRAYQANDIKVVNCTAANFHSFAQITGGSNISFEQVTSSCVRGISLGSATNCLVSNCNITATGDKKYGIRHSADSSNDVLKVVNTTVNAFIPVVTRKTNDTTIESYKLVFEGNNTLTESGDYKVVIAKEEYDEVGMTLTALPNVTVTGADATWTVWK